MTEEQATRAEKEEEQAMHWLRRRVDLTRTLLYQIPDLPFYAAVKLVHDTRRQVLEKFPGKEETFDLIYWPRFLRTLRERYGAVADELESP